MLNQIAELLQKPLNRSWIVVTANNRLAYQLYHNLNFICRFFNYSYLISLFPSYETLPYENLAIRSDILYERLRILTQLNHQPQIVITEISTLLRKVIPPKSIRKGFLLNQTTTFSLLQKNLENQGYIRVDQVTAPEEYAIRGSIIDIWLGENAYRLDFEDEHLNTIYYLDPVEQRSLTEIQQVSLFPTHEVILDKKNIATFQTNWQKQFGNLKSNLQQKIVQGHYAPGMENYLPLFYPNMVSLLTHFIQSPLLLILGDLKTSALKFSDLVHQRYQNLVEKTVLPPEDLFFKLEDLELTNLPKLELPKVIERTPEITVTVSNSTYYLETLGCPIINNFKDISPNYKYYGIFDDFFDTELTISSSQFSLSFRAKALLEKGEKRTLPLPSSPLNTDLARLKEGELIVHRDYGIGRYLGLVKEKLGDFILLEYEGGSRLYLASHQLNLISRYLGQNKTTLNRLNSSLWGKTKKVAKKQLEDLAAELIKVQAKRQVTFKKPFEIPPEYQRFQELFPYTLTKDQEITLKAIQQDFQKNQLIDRLICGDVGFGKTELAMHAAFLAVYNNQQVIIMVPTTLLATQHFETFKKRFTDFPIKIGILTRLISNSSRQKLIAQFNQKKIDILITTHLNLAGSLENLGLLIIDEEHRFGVKQKEYFKKLVPQLGVLSLTATPIPRSLNLAMVGIRDFSILKTAPVKRLKIKTLVETYRESLIKEAIHRELLRGGQVYFVHNRINQLPKFKDLLKKLFPDAEIVILHGRTENSDLIMQRFHQHQIDILLCTTVIESGIDFENVNTIIITQAERFGIANLHQLRGRVGRFHRQAYAYLLTDENITENAKKRLNTLVENDDLGSGLDLAIEDLELRGAGEFLGKKQSGAINSLGLNLYLELLQQTIEHNETDVETVIIETNLEVRLPEIYVPEVALRLWFYKQLSICPTEKQIDQIIQELEDRFGRLPEPASNLVRLAKYKLRFKFIGLKKAILKKNWQLFFEEPSKYFNPKGFIFFQEMGEKISYNAQSINLTPYPNKTFWQHLEFLTQGLEKIYASN